jgi:cell envelope opacity-associated protein A
MRLNKGQITLMLLSVALISAGLTLPSSDAGTALSPLTKTIQIQLPKQPEFKPESVAHETLPVQLNWKEFKVKKGDSLALIFRRAGEKATTLHNIMSSGETTA